jgi:hypothetical protein
MCFAREERTPATLIDHDLEEEGLISFGLYRAKLVEKLR